MWEISILEYLAAKWEVYHSNLFWARIMLSSHLDYMVWGGYLLDGRISATKLYEHIISCSLILLFSNLTEQLWFWDVPLKIICFTWLILHNWIFTWDTLMKKGFVGPRRCPHYKSTLEDCIHFFIHFPFAQEIWNKVSSHLGTQFIGDSSSIGNWLCS